jgi:hypothetical protein
MIYNSLAGGTGSGLTAKILEKVKNEFPQKSIHSYNVYPDEREI